MFFPPNIPLSDVKKWIDTQLPAVLNVAKRGIEVNIMPHKSKRTLEQNRFLMVIMTAIVRFYHDTGFMPQGCQTWMMRTDIQKEYWKARYGIESTSKMDTAEFTKFIDFIQHNMVEESGGEYEILQTDSAYLKSLVEEGWL